MSKKIVEAYWDCIHCGTKDISGLVKTCPNCGNPQSENVKFHLKPGNKKYLEPEKAKEYGKGADWVCAYCNSYNRYNELNCRNCGAGKAESEKDYFGKKVKVTNQEENYTYYYGTKQRETTSTPCEEEDLSDTADEAKKIYSCSNFDTLDEEKDSLEKRKNLKPKKILACIGGIFAIIAIIILLVSIFTPKTYDAKISNKSWKRSIRIEELKTFKESGWDVPEGARVYDEKDEILKYEPVFDHYDIEEYEETHQEFDHYDKDYIDNGDGTFTEEKTPVYKTVKETKYRKVAVYKDVPVWATKYYYEIDRWCCARTEESSGENNNPYWPKYTLGDKEKKAGETQKYTVYLQTDKKTYSKTVTYEEWKDYELEVKVHITVTAGIVTKIEP